jgi:hypothetical protein
MTADHWLCRIQLRDILYKEHPYREATIPGVKQTDVSRDDKWVDRASAGGAEACRPWSCEWSLETFTRGQG